MEEIVRAAPLAFRQFILKLHGRCNLACDYCYLYTKADHGWQLRPRALSPELADRTVARIAEHVAAHRVPTLAVLLHGGEPLLGGLPLVRRIADALRDKVAARVRLSMQTNGTLLTEATLEVLSELDVGVGVSLDGDRIAHDRHRRGPGGQGSHADTAAALRRLNSPAFREIYRGVLCTIDLRNDPVACYEALLEFSPPRVDFLLPHHTWDAPPPGAGRYADWLIRIFDRWYGADRRETGVRLFEEIIHVLFGGRSAVESVGGPPSAPFLVVETDGSISRSDILASAAENVAKTGLHVDRDPFDAALPGAAPPPLSASCRACDLVRVCGGGLPTHRYRSGSGFDNPSVYCADLYRLIAHIRARLTADLGALRGTR
ncbi:FxsB family cyclophane-forming radical SAM/SPASM peptide maturase [Amycolatopsis sp. DG1A-15b]|uniref:FxsB family cyclophane-forming radical SAM/SPASM peptide maturase n=1 Tax=Amycolatopsis sp. DG1A-15b TaxID=3052846 RepID=UPI00255B8047|nr:FxsB family cyclophane-forming radical SAM/SPASM peptide maturase [Amycolatopsis sp. DG1A-15b]WIX88184.1 FxsB family cyclophane-forming radical SAM/SPASM peptide maturase [Amycolatopsis sp. DG1A-15b]